MDDRERLEAIVEVVRRYLPIDGISIEEAIGEIIELADPLPDTLSPKRDWVGLTDEEIKQIELSLRQYNSRDTYDLSLKDFAKTIEAKLREKNGE